MKAQINAWEFWRKNSWVDKVEEANDKDSQQRPLVFNFLLCMAVMFIVQNQRLSYP